MSETPIEATERQHRRSDDPTEATLTKLKNSGYMIIAMFLIQSGILYEHNRGVEAANDAAWVRQQVRDDKQDLILQELKASNVELKISNAGLQALVQGQDRRITGMENRSK